MFQTPTDGSLSLDYARLRPKRSSVCHFGRLRNAEDHRNSQFREFHAPSESTCVLPMEGQCDVRGGPACAHSGGRVIRHSEIAQVTSTNTLTIPFKEVRGGDLEISVSMQLGRISATGKSNRLKIVGTSPSIAILSSVARPKKAFRKLMRLESALQQFLANGSPKFSQDKGGVGLCQITNPKPTDEEVWNWKANVKKGWEIYQVKERIAKTFPREVRTSEGFNAQVAEYITRCVPTA